VKRVGKAKPPLAPQEKKSEMTDIRSLDCATTSFGQGEVASDAF